MADFLLELRCEEIPARMQAGARADLERLLRDNLRAAGVSHGALTVWSTPRRLALIVRDLPLQTEAVREELKGPRTSAPPQALEGFLRKTGLTQDQLEARGDTYYAVIERPGRATKDVLAWAIAAIVKQFPWPKSMRWGAASISTASARWVRPLSGIVALLGEDVVDFEVGGVQSGAVTLGHRFHHPGMITIGSAADYQDKLRACHVIVDHATREGTVREMARAAALAAKLTLVEDEGLVVENAGLTEWPVPLLGRFDAEFLTVPPEVIQLTARVNQKYFVCHDESEGSGGKLANAFVCTANIGASDGGAAIVDGNRKVLAARLSDARFFWDQDRKTPLAEHAKKLERITFHEKLGTVADKVERVAKLARWLVEEGIVPPTHTRHSREGGNPDNGEGARNVAYLDHRLRGGDVSESDRAFLADQAEQAARLAKADLVTEMVGEFPELQGLMGGYYARAEGMPDAVSDAIRDHYKPVGQSDDVPTAPVTVAVSLADKLDTLFWFFAIGEKPSGSKDPYALRRAALGVLNLLQRNDAHLLLGQLPAAVAAITLRVLSPRIAAEIQAFKIETKALDQKLEAARQFEDSPALALRILERSETNPWPELEAMVPVLKLINDGEFRGADLLTFFADRLKVQQKEAGVRHDLIDAVFALGGEDDLVRLLARVHALQAFVGTEDGTNLLAGYKRAANILKKEGWQETPPTLQGRGPGGGEVPLALRQDNSPHPNPSPEGEGLIPRDGEEDPFAMVDDPDVAAAMRERMAVKKTLSYTPEPAEKALIDALDAAGPTAQAAVEAEDFAGAMAALASLRAPIDAFFEEVTVNDADPAKRAARLALLGRFRGAVHGVADFSRIEG